MGWLLLKDIVLFLLWLYLNSRKEAAVAFTPEPTIFKLVFDEGTPLHGLTIRAKSCTIGEWHQMLSDTGVAMTGAEAVQANDKYAQMFLDHVVEWDLEIPAGHPVPLTVEGWNTIQKEHGEMIIAAWQVTMIAVPKISKNGSPVGGISAEQSLDLASLSESLPNWNEPS